MSLALALLAGCSGTVPTAAPVATNTAQVNTTPASAPTDTVTPEASATAVPGSTSARQVITWYQYDQTNTDPKSDERVGNAYMRQAIAQFNQDMHGKLTWVNQPQAWDKMVLALVAAVQGGGEVPDVFNMSTDNMVTFYNNGTVQDLTAWATQQAWYKDLDPNAIKACTGPDGRLYCVPVASLPQVMFYWTARFPNGYPKTPDEFLTQAAALKQKGLYAITYFGSTDFAGEAAMRYFFMTIASFGGTYDDGKGNMLLNTPEDIAAVQFMREVVAKGYSPDIVFAGNFQEEQPMKDASAGSISTGVFGYRYINPLKAPDGKTYNSMVDAINAGEVKLASFFAPPGKTPSCSTSYTGFVIPKGARNVDGAHQYINWVMDAKNNPAWVQAPGAGLPAEESIAKDPAFQTTFYKQAIAASQGLCRSWSGSLTKLPDAKKIIATAIYHLIKEDPTADIASTLQAAQDEYNRNK